MGKMAGIIRILVITNQDLVKQITILTATITALADTVNRNHREMNRRMNATDNNRKNTATRNTNIPANYAPPAGPSNTANTPKPTIEAKGKGKSPRNQQHRHHHQRYQPSINGTPCTRRGRK